MVNLLRNREVRCQLYLIVAVGLSGIILCNWMKPFAEFIVVGMVLLLILLFLLYTNKRYAEIARLSDCLAKIVGGDLSLDLREYAEGELSILKDEIYKVTRTLVHQAESLAQDKSWLADTMADISHQLKTPLTSVSIMTELLREPELPDEQRELFLHNIRQGTERIRGLVSALLKLSRLDANAVTFHYKPLLVEELLERSLEQLRIPMELREQHLELSLEEASVTGDLDWLAEAVANLFENCIEHTPVGGKIRVRCTVNPLYILLEIRDNGPGIDTEDLPHLFERFYRGKDAKNDSVGIGLALSKSIIMNHGGSLGAGNHPEGGAVFTVRFYSQHLNTKTSSRTKTDSQVEAGIPEPGAESYPLSGSLKLK